MNLVGFIVRIYHDARSPERQMVQCSGNICNVAEGSKCQHSQHSINAQFSPNKANEIIKS